MVMLGFIDLYIYVMDDLLDFVKNKNLNYLMQGVIIVVIGSDGGSVLQIGEKFKEWEEQGIGINVVIMVGYWMIW